ncbi:MAG: alpha/beta fold hydrolase [Spirochaetales bacterium]|nr:alpha/beta fold hydrolase [Spirochaetales bacterium]
MESKFITVKGLTLHYLESGSGDPVLLLHGWPTSSFLWRNIIPEIARGRRTIALDLPGFGKSDKPLDRVYSFRFFSDIINEFLDTLNIKKTGLAVHDLGGPVGLFWATAHPERLEKLAILNTLVYPQLSWAVVLFVTSLRLPFIKEFLVSPAGIRLGMRMGIRDKSRRTAEMFTGTTAPFESEEARQALIKAGIGLNPRGFALIAGRLKNIQCPVQILYGTQDSILPDIAKTVNRLEKDLADVRTTAIEGCGHFLQEDQPEAVAEVLGKFFNSGT